MENVPAAVHAASGAIGSSYANFLLFPLDIVTVRLQVERDVHASAGVPPGHHSSILEMFKTILHREGWSSLYKGSIDDSFGTALQSFLYFFVYEYLRSGHIRAIVRRKGFAPRMLSIRYELLYGAAAGMLCKLVTTPIKNIVVLKQVDPHIPVSMLDCARDIYKRKGITGLWSGYKATFFLSINPSLAYYFYQLLSAYYHDNRTMAVFLKAAIAKSIATLLTYPVIQAKTRTQASKTETHILKDMWASLKSGRISNWFDGIDGQLLKGFFVQGITMASKERISSAVVFLYIQFLRRRKQRTLRVQM